MNIISRKLFKEIKQMFEDMCKGGETKMIQDIRLPKPDGFDEFVKEVKRIGKRGKNER